MSWIHVVFIQASRNPGSGRSSAIFGFRVQCFGVQCFGGSVLIGVILGAWRLRVKEYWRITTWKVEDDREIKWKTR